MLKVVILLCRIAAGECTLATAESHFTILTSAQTPMGCILVGYQELAKLSSYDPKMQLARITCGRS